MKLKAMIISIKGTRLTQMEKKLLSKENLGGLFYSKEI